MAGGNRTGCLALVTIAVTRGRLGLPVGADKNFALSEPGQD